MGTEELEGVMTASIRLHYKGGRNPIGAPTSAAALTQAMADEDHAPAGRQDEGRSQQLAITRCDDTPDRARTASEGLLSARRGRSSFSRGC
jgi:hypothetical protein